jgi:hypothetical protein
MEVYVSPAVKVNLVRDVRQMTKSSNRGSALKILELVFCAVLLPRVLEAISLSGPIWYGVGVFAGSALGYWVPPVERWTSFKRWLVFSLFLGYVAFLLAKYHPFARLTTS